MDRLVAALVGAPGGPDQFAAPLCRLANTAMADVGAYAVRGTLQGSEARIATAPFPTPAPVWFAMSGAADGA